MKTAADWSASPAGTNQRPPFTPRPKTKTNGAMRPPELVDTRNFTPYFRNYLTVIAQGSSNDGCLQYAAQETVFARHGD